MQDIPKDTLISASKGDIKAFEEIYKSTSSFVYSVAYRVTNSADDADDITQEVFLKIHNNLGKFMFRSSFKSWVYRITVNTAINACKKRSKEMNRRGNYDIAIETKSAKSNVKETIDKKDNEYIINNLLSKLTYEQRICIILREIEGLSYKEISKALNTNINTIRTRLKRARQALINLGKNEVVGYEL